MAAPGAACAHGAAPADAPRLPGGFALDARGADLLWQGRRARASREGDGYRLQDATGAVRELPRPPMRTRTANALFDALFALAQEELAQAQVESIRDAAFDRGRPIACPCFETGEKWPYVWTRDVSYAADLALARFAPERTRASLRFKLSGVRAPGAPQGRYVAQDTGSGGSWPISTDRVVWFLAAQRLLEGEDGADDEARRFAEEVWAALADTLAQDRQYAFDPRMGLYRGETSFLDWREQSYPRWTANDVGFIGQSFALSTNVLHYRALRLGERLARERGDPRAERYAAQAAALAQAIERAFWREDRGLYMSYVGTAAHPVPFEAYDLLGLALLIDSGLAPPQRARRALSRYPAGEAGSPVIWPQQPDVAIYHNRAIWPFVSAYALRAARRLEHAERIEHEIRSLVRGAALAGSNMENFELTTQDVRFEDGALSGPVVNSRRQLWSVAGYLQMVVEGVFGVEADGTVAPKLPSGLVPLLFGEDETIALDLRERGVVLHRPEAGGRLYVAGTTWRDGAALHVRLVPARATGAAPLARDAAAFAPPSPQAPPLREEGEEWRIAVPARHRLYLDGALHREAAAQPVEVALPKGAAQRCLSLTRVGGNGLESLHGPTRCVGEDVALDGAWPRRWRAPAAGRYALSVDFANANGPINTGITAAVKRLVVECAGRPPQDGPLVMPHGEGAQRSNAVVVELDAGAECRFELRDGFNMSYLRHFARYTGGRGGAEGPLNEARIGALRIVPVAAATSSGAVPAKAGAP
nr:Six-hairpin glycosidase-like protein [Vulcaniibacterium tengchongense]